MKYIKLFEKLIQDINKEDIIKKIILDDDFYISYVDIYEFETGIDFNIIKNKKDFDIWLKTYLSNRYDDVYDDLNRLTKNNYIDIYRAMEVRETG